MGKTTLRQDAWKASFEVLRRAGISEAQSRNLAEEITDSITDMRGEGRPETGNASRVPASVKRAIEEDLQAGTMSFAAIRDKHSVGTSTVQRIANELRAKGTTVRTAGQTNPGLILA